MGSVALKACEKEVALVSLTEPTTVSFQGMFPEDQHVLRVNDSSEGGATCAILGKDSDWKEEGPPSADGDCSFSNMDSSTSDFGLFMGNIGELVASCTNLDVFTSVAVDAALDLEWLWSLVGVYLLIAL